MASLLEEIYFISFHVPIHYLMFLYVLYSGVIRRQGSPPHPLSGFIQAQIHSQQIHVQNLQLPHVPYPTPAAQMHPAAAQERFPGFQHGQTQAPVVPGNQVILVPNWTAKE